MYALNGSISQASASVHGVVSSIDRVCSARAGDRATQRRVKRRERMLKAGAFGPNRDVLVQVEGCVVVWLLAVVERHRLVLVVLQLLQQRFGLLHFADLLVPVQLVVLSVGKVRPSQRDGNRSFPRLCNRSASLVEALLLVFILPVLCLDGILLLLIASEEGLIN